MLLVNSTPFAVEQFALNDETGAPILLVLLKATFSFTLLGEVTVSSVQKPVEVADQFTGKPGESSISCASDFSYNKTATDIVLTGNAYPSRESAVERFVSMSVGTIVKEVIVFGNRHWKKVLGFSVLSSPEPFEKIPLIYENSYGGYDCSHNHSTYHQFESRNPVGKGFRAKKSMLKSEQLQVPNIEDCNDLLSNPGEHLTPQGFGFISPSWQPRLSFAGTYDKKWRQERMPLLPVDFNRRFFNTAHPDLIYPGYIQGGELVAIDGTFADRHTEVSLTLPNIAAECQISTSDYDQLQPISLKTDRVHFNTEEMLFTVLESGTIHINDPQSIRETTVSQTREAVWA